MISPGTSWGFFIAYCVYKRIALYLLKAKIMITTTLKHATKFKRFHGFEVVYSNDQPVGLVLERKSKIVQLDATKSDLNHRIKEAADFLGFKFIPWADMSYEQKKYVTQLLTQIKSK